MYPVGTWRTSTSMQCHDVASTLSRHCINVMCSLGSYDKRLCIESWQTIANLLLLSKATLRKFCKILTLKTPRKPASKNVVCLCRLLNILANFSNLFLHTGRQSGPKPGAVWSWSTLFAKWLLKNHKQMTRQTTIVVIGSLSVKSRIDTVVHVYSSRSCHVWLKMSSHREFS